jgi:hypothetical protein
MTVLELYQALNDANTVSDVEDALDRFNGAHAREVRWMPVGNKENNRGVIEVSADPGRSVIERATNGIDAVLEAEHILHDGIPVCRTPKEAATAWLGVPVGGLSEMTPTQRRALGQRVSIKMTEGDGKSLRTVEVRDLGVGLTPEQMPGTILSLNESNKMQKHYLAGAYGQGGSSTFASSKYTFIASRYDNRPTIGFTVVFYEDLPAEQFKTGRYVYLTLDGSILKAEVPLKDFPTGTTAKHFGYDLTNYTGSLGPASVYGLLNQILFDPVMPVWFDNRVHDYRRVIKGTRNALNGAVDEGDAEGRGPTLSHNVRMFYTTIGEFGQIGIEYWVLEPPNTKNKKPSASYINPAKPIILTLNGQNQAEMSHVLVRKDAELPYLTQRLICHVDCNSLTPTAKRELFVSNREDARRGIVYNLIQQEVIKALKSDDELTRLNSEARDTGRREEDQTVLEQTRKEVARLLRLQGVPVGLEGLGGQTTEGPGTGTDKPPRPDTPTEPRPKPRPIELHEPPTFIRIMWKEDGDITFHPQQRRYIRIETDAYSQYHNPNNPSASRINIFAINNGVAFRGSTPLEGGRMRGIFEGTATANVGDTGTIRVELTRPGMPMLFDERPFRVVEPPPIQEKKQRVTLPPFHPIPVDGPDDLRWTSLGWPDNPNMVASSAEMEDGVLNIYYSTVFPRYVEQRAVFERRGDLAIAESFTKRYEIWLAVHSLIYYQDQQQEELQGQTREEEEEIFEERERQERCRIATLAALFAAREIQQGLPSSDD